MKFLVVCLLVVALASAAPNKRGNRKNPQQGNTNPGKSMQIGGLNQGNPSMGSQNQPGSQKGFEGPSMEIGQGFNHAQKESNAKEMEEKIQEQLKDQASELPAELNITFNHAQRTNQNKQTGQKGRQNNAGQGQQKGNRMSPQNPIGPQNGGNNGQNEDDNQNGHGNNNNGGRQNRPPKQNGQGTSINIDFYWQ